MSEAVSSEVGKVWEKLIAFIKDGYQNDTTYYALGREFLIAHGMEADDERITNEFIDQLLDAYLTPWNQFFFSHDPANDIKKINKPLLAVFGGKDEQTTVALNLLPLQKALSEAGNKQYQITVLADEDHFFVRYQNERQEKHKFGEMKISGKLMETMIDWLYRQKVVPEKK